MQGTGPIGFGYGITARGATAGVDPSERTLLVTESTTGGMARPKLSQKHGVELRFFTNHVGHFILVNELIEHLGEDARAVVVSSDAHHSAQRVARPCILTSL